MARVVLTVALFALFALVGAQRNFNNYEPMAVGNVASEWSGIHLLLAQKCNPFPGPPWVARGLAMHMTAVYDGFSLYTSYMNPVMNQTSSYGRRPYDELSINITVSYAAYRVLQSLFAARQAIFNSNATTYFKSLGYDPLNNQTDVSTPDGLGNQVAADVIAFRMNDGANQLGNMPGSRSYGTPYTDYTNYNAVNPPQTVTGITNCSFLRSFDHWQPLLVPNAMGTSAVQGYLGPQLGNVIPFALPAAGFFRPGSPPLCADPRQHQMCVNNFTEVLTTSGSLGDMEKVIAEFWADGPTSTTPPGHWHQIALDTAHEENLDLAETIQILFLQANAAFDAGLAIWDAKRYYDSARPISAIQCLYNKTQVQAWAGPYMGNHMIDGSLWKPWQEKYFITPPFPEYPSGHSGFSGACAEVLKLFFNDDTFRGKNYTILAGHSVIEPMILANQSGYIAGFTDVPNSGTGTPGYTPANDITLTWPTYSAAADQAALSRLYGGIHTPYGNNVGVIMGRKVGDMVYQKAMTYFNNPPTGTTGGYGTTAGLNPATSTGPVVSSTTSGTSSAPVVNNNDDHALSGGAIIGIVLGSMVFGLLIGLCIAFAALALARRRNARPPVDLPPMHNEVVSREASNLQLVSPSNRPLVNRSVNNPAFTGAPQAIGDDTNRDIEAMQEANTNMRLDEIKKSLG